MGTKTINLFLLIGNIGSTKEHDLCTTLYLKASKRSKILQNELSKFSIRKKWFSEISLLDSLHLNKFKNIKHNANLHKNPHRKNNYSRCRIIRHNRRRQSQNPRQRRDPYIITKTYFRR